jgi:predicted alpha/beta superfamily hydrolase
MRAIHILVLLAGCHGNAATGGDDDDAPDAAPPPDGATGCPAGKAGAACVLDLYDRAVGCDAAIVTELRGELEARAGLGPLWANGRALFRTQEPTYVAGTFNDWSATALRSSPLCDSGLVLAVGAVATGAHQYKLTDGAAWTLDPANPAFAYDDFAGNPDGRNSALVTPDSGRGYLVNLAPACSPALANCRDVTAYLPPAYDALEQAATTYPVLFMHDGQNVWDDHDCCFGHTGWEVNVALDTEIAAGRVAPVIVIAGDNTTARNNEYGLSPATMTAFMQFQVTELQPAALAKVRWDGARVGVGGSSLGGLVAMHLALTYPQTYAAGVSLSGAFWPGMDDGTALRDRLPALGKQPIAIYLDHGGAIAANTDGAADSVEVRDDLVALGWTLACTPGPNSLCYHHEPGATHDELAWRARTWRFLQFLYPAR